MPGEKPRKPFWPTVLGASVFAGLLIIGFEIGRSAGEEKPNKARSTLLAKAGKDRPKASPTSAPSLEATPEAKPAPASTIPSSPKPPRPKPVPPTTKPEPKPEPKAPKPPEPSLELVTFDKVLPIFKAKCNICHGDPSIKGELDLRSIAAIAKSPNKMMVVPGNPEKSELWLQVGGDDPVMPPPGKEKLTAVEKKMIQDWIRSGGK